jgi:hypothetical protein
MAPHIVNPSALTPRESFLAAAIGAMIGCGLFSFFLAGRVSERTHVALAMLVALIGGFSLLTLFAPVGHDLPIVDGLLLVGLIGLFKLMNQFEIHRRPRPGPAVGRSDPPPHR